MRDPRPDSDGRCVDAGESPFERRCGSCRHFVATTEMADLFGQLFCGRGRGQADRPGVGIRRRKGPEPDAHPYAQRLCDLDNRFGEPIPAEIGFRAGENEEVLPGEVATVADLDARPCESGVDAVHQAHSRAPGPLVDQLVCVETDESVGSDLELEVADGCRPAIAGADNQPDNRRRAGFAQGNQQRFERKGKDAGSVVATGALALGMLWFILREDGNRRAGASAGPTSERDPTNV